MDVSNTSFDWRPRSQNKIFKQVDQLVKKVVLQISAMVLKIFSHGFNLSVFLHISPFFFKHENFNKWENRIRCHVIQTTVAEIFTFNYGNMISRAKTN
jgi:hypothetical protein